MKYTQFLKLSMLYIYKRQMFWGTCAKRLKWQEGIGEKYIVIE